VGAISLPQHALATQAFDAFQSPLAIGLRSSLDREL